MPPYRRHVGALTRHGGEGGGRRGRMGASREDFPRAAQDGPRTLWTRSPAAGQGRKFLEHGYHRSHSPGRVGVVRLICDRGPSPRSPDGRKMGCLRANAAGPLSITPSSPSSSSVFDDITAVVGPGLHWGRLGAGQNRLVCNTFRLPARCCAQALAIRQDSAGGCRSSFLLPDAFSGLSMTP
ncbi:hypothetical protein GQ53DRAFT_177408 [Thozetella sp. PMI_491]|nr:hypothetical protein GQ53DRAFT_177408 [Thozetella sp. PMI_491]